MKFILEGPLSGSPGTMAITVCLTLLITHTKLLARINVAQRTSLIWSPEQELWVQNEVEIESDAEEMLHGKDFMCERSQPMTLTSDSCKHVLRSGENITCCGNERYELTPE